ncbi:hypothetical protein GWI33_002928, partial [Rhynchophorus ferrugineus]
PPQRNPLLINEPQQPPPSQNYRRPTPRRDTSSFPIQNSSHLSSSQEEYIPPQNNPLQINEPQQPSPSQNYRRPTPRRNTSSSPIQNFPHLSSSQEEYMPPQRNPSAINDPQQLPPFQNYRRPTPRRDTSSFPIQNSPYLSSSQVEYIQPQMIYLPINYRLADFQVEYVPPPHLPQFSVSRNTNDVHTSQSGPSAVKPTVPKVKHTKKDKTFPRGQKICVVCLDKFRRRHCVMQLRCQHRFHDSCIQEWLNHNTVCPVCRSDVHSSRDIEIVEWEE